MSKANALEADTGDTSYDDQSIFDDIPFDEMAYDQGQAEPRPGDSDDGPLEVGRAGKARDAPDGGESGEVAAEVRQAGLGSLFGDTPAPKAKAPKIVEEDGDLFAGSEDLATAPKVQGRAPQQAADDGLFGKPAADEPGDEPLFSTRPTNRARRAVLDFVRSVTSRKPIDDAKRRFEIFGLVSDEQAAAIRESAAAQGVDLDVTGYTHEIDNYGVRHAFKRHGGASDRLRGLEPITEEDFALIPDVVARATPVYERNTKAGAPAVVYRARFGAKLIELEYVSETHHGHKALTLKTFLKRKITAGETVNKPSLFTPEAIPAATDNIAPDDAEGNGGPQARAPDTAAPQLTEDFTSKADAVYSSLRAELDKVGLTAVDLRVENSIFATSDGGISFSAEPDADQINGFFWRNTIGVALDSQDGTAYTLNHEIVHGLCSSRLWGGDFGLFKSAEWSTMERAVRADSARMANIRRRYKDLTDARMIEEGIADMYADWKAGRYDAKGFIAAAFKRIAAFIEALGNALRGNGFNTAEDVFRGISGGTVGARGAAPQDSGGDMRASRQQQDTDDRIAFSREDRALNRFTYQGYERADVPRVHATQRIHGLIGRLDAGNLTPSEFEMQVRLLANRMAEVSDTKAVNRIVRERARGEDIVRESGDPSYDDQRLFDDIPFDEEAYNQGQDEPRPGNRDDGPSEVGPATEAGNAPEGSEGGDAAQEGAGEGVGAIAGQRPVSVTPTCSIYALQIYAPIRPMSRAFSSSSDI